MVGVAHHAQPGRGGIDDHTTEGLALGDGFVRSARRQDDPAVVPADGHPAQTENDEECDGEAGQRPEGIVKEMLVGHRVNRAPTAVCLFMQTEHQAVGTEIQAFVQVSQCRSVADQYPAGRRDEGKAVIHGPGHDAFEVVDLGQIDQRCHLEPTSARARRVQGNTGIRQYPRRGCMVGMGDVAAPDDRLILRPGALLG
ncbi:hypothetical protein D3C76_1286890 [compost metagenome]